MSLLVTLQAMHVTNLELVEISGASANDMTFYRFGEAIDLIE